MLYFELFDSVQRLWISASSIWWCKLCTWKVTEFSVSPITIIFVFWKLLWCHTLHHYDFQVEICNILTLLLSDLPDLLWSHNSITMLIWYWTRIYDVGCFPKICEGLFSRIIVMRSEQPGNIMTSLFMLKYTIVLKGKVNSKVFKYEWTSEISS